MKVELNHNYTQTKAYEAIPRLVRELTIRNHFEITKELYAMGEFTKEDYVKLLWDLAKQ